MIDLLKLYQYAIRTGAPLLRVLLKTRVKKGKENPTRLGERTGKASRPRPNGRLFWLHAASVGEAQSALILIDALGRAGKDMNVLVTTGTVTSAELMEKRLPSFAFHQFVPLDHPVWVKKFLDHWKPDLALWMESELWPNILTMLKERNVPTVLVNARLSERSFARWKMAKNFAGQILDCFTMILAQTENDAQRFTALGAGNVYVTDNIKYSAAPLPHDDLALSELKLAVADRKIWVYASTHDGEESLACRVHKNLREEFPDLLTIIVPRHPNRRDDVAEVCFEEGLKFRLRSNNNALPNAEDDIYVADTMGELGLFYTLSPIAMIGRSFSNDGGGGHNPVEAAQLNCAVLTGANNQYQRQIYDDMAAADAVIELQNEEELQTVLQAFFNDTDAVASWQHKAFTFAEQKAHVVDDVLEKLMPLIGRTERKDAA